MNKGILYLRGELVQDPIVEHGQSASEEEYPPLANI